MNGHTRILVSPEGTRYRFDAGAFSLELLLTGGPGALQRYEILHTPQALVAWLAESRLNIAADQLRITRKDLADTIRFRDTMWSVANAFADGRPVAPSDIELINAAASAAPRPALDPATLSAGWVTPVSGAQVLGAAARDAIAVIAEGRIRRCAGDRCYLMFVDTSRPGNRRWCSMQRCGNRHKIRALRARAG